MAVTGVVDGPTLCREQARAAVGERGLASLVRSEGYLEAAPYIHIAHHSEHAQAATAAAAAVVVVVVAAVVKANQSDRQPPWLAPQPRRSGAMGDLRTAKHSERQASRLQSCTHLWLYDSGAAVAAKPRAGYVFEPSALSALRSEAVDIEGHADTLAVALTLMECMKGGRLCV